MSAPAPLPAPLSPAVLRPALFTLSRELKAADDVSGGNQEVTAAAVARRAAEQRDRTLAVALEAVHGLAQSTYGTAAPSLVQLNKTLAILVLPNHKLSGAAATAQQSVRAFALSLATRTPAIAAT